MRIFTKKMTPDNVFKSFSAALTGLTFALISSCGPPSDGEQDGKHDNLTQKKEVREERYDVYDYKGNDSSCVEIIESLYDTAGKITLETIFDGGYTRIGGKRYEYSPSGKLIYTSYLESFVYKETDTIIYDAKDQPLKEEKLITSNHIPTRRIFTEFRDGRVWVKLEDDLLREKLNWVDTFMWENNGKNLLKKGYDGSMKHVFNSESVYDDKGNETEYKRFSPGGELLRTALHVYDTSGTLLSYTEKRDDSITMKEVYTLNSAGKKVKLECYEPGSILDLVYQYMYNGNGDLLCVLKFNGKGLLLRKIFYTYEYHGYAD